MAMLKRTEVAQPSVQREPAPVPSLKGDVIVRSRMLADRMVLNAIQAAVSPALPGEAEEHRQVRVGSILVAHTLARQVVLEDDEPMWSADQWAVHGASHPQEVLTLYDVAQRLSGSQIKAAELEKNS